VKSKNVISNQLTFGQALRAKRQEKKYGLREFAEMVGVSPTYLTQVEQSNVAPPTAERISRIAELLQEDPDEWTLLAGRLPEDLLAVFQKNPKYLPTLLREASELSSEDVQQLVHRVRDIKRGKLA
jgi:HTH-type transcriptional regulator, competence development regulator